eukprot:1921693-Alexandrium_andersonii.AAC.1
MEARGGLGMEARGGLGMEAVPGLGSRVLAAGASPGARASAHCVWGVRPRILGMEARGGLEWRPGGASEWRPPRASYRESWRLAPLGAR